MTINPFISSEYIIHGPSSAIEEIRGDVLLHTFVIIMENEKYIGLVTCKSFLTPGQPCIMNILQENVTVEYGSGISETMNLMESKDLFILPVFKENKFAGILKYTTVLQKLLAEQITNRKKTGNEPVFDSKGETTGIPGISRDITEFELENESLRKRKTIFKTAFELHSSLMAITTVDGGIYIDVNKAFCEILGYDKKEIIGRSSVDLKIWASNKSREDVLSLYNKQGYLSNHEVEYYAKNREKRNGLFSIATIIIDGNMFLLTSMTDITKQKQLEKELEQHRDNLESILEIRSRELFESEKNYKEIINTITDYVYHVKIDSRKNMQVKHTEGCFTVTGYHVGEFINEPQLWFNIVFESDREAVNKFFKTVHSGPGINKKIVHRIVHKNGRIKWIENTIIIHRNTKGRITGYDGIIKDITEKKNSEDEIKRLNQHIIMLQEDERLRVARDLHDSVGQTILAAKINIEAYMQNPDRFKNQIDVGLSFLIQASSELREIYTGLYPTVLNDLGLEMAIRLLISNSIETAGIAAEVDISIDGQLSHDLNVSLYRIIQEIISNILKHSQATLMQLQLVLENHSLTLTVSDNGKGFAPEIVHNTARGYGLANIKSRIENYNGTITIENNIPSGIIICITIESLRSD